MPLPLLILLAALSAAAPPRPGAAAPMALAGGPGEAALGSRLGAPLRTLGELSESELDRYAFLMLDPASSGGDTIPAGTVTRRITPKSVFIAPSINGDQCAEGYQLDEMGRCVKVVKVNAEKSWDLLLDKLNNQFASEIIDMQAETEPTPPPGPLQVAIPIAGLPEEFEDSEESVEVPAVTEAPPALPAGTPSPAPPSVPENLTETATDAVPDLTTETAAEETTVVTERDVTAQLEDEDEDDDDSLSSSSSSSSSSEEEDPFSVIFAEEQSIPHAPSEVMEMMASHLVTPKPVPDSEENILPLVAPPVNTSVSDSDTNPIINTVNNSPLVTGDTGDALVKFLAPIVAEASASATATSLLPAPAIASSSVEMSSTESALLSPASSTTEASITFSPSPSEESSTAASSFFKHSTADPTQILTMPLVLDVSTQAPLSSTESVSSTATSIRATSTTEEDGTTPGTSTASESPAQLAEQRVQDQKWNNGIPRRPSGSPARYPLPDVVRFPTEKPTIFRTSSGGFRFPSIDVTFPTSPGTSSGSAPGNKLLSRPLAFPKDDKPPWRLPPSSPASNWSLEQTRNRPQLYRYWSRAPSTLSRSSTRDGSRDSSGDSSSSDSDRSSTSVSSASTPPASASSIWPLRTNSSPSAYWKTQIPLSSSSRSTWHRRGRDW